MLYMYVCLQQSFFYLVNLFRPRNNSTKLQDGGQKAEYAQITTFSFSIFQND